MLGILLAAGLFPTHARIPFSHAVRVAIVQGSIVVVGEGQGLSDSLNDSSGGFAEMR
jgi:hypothetical protein